MSVAHDAGRTVAVAQCLVRPPNGNAGERLEEKRLGREAAGALFSGGIHPRKHGCVQAARTLAGSLLLTVADLRAHPPLLATLFAAAFTRLLRTQVQPALRGVACRSAGRAGLLSGGDAVCRPRAPHVSGRAGGAASAEVGGEGQRTGRSRLRPDRWGGGRVFHRDGHGGHDGHDGHDGRNNRWKLCF